MAQGLTPKHKALTYISLNFRPLQLQLAALARIWEDCPLGEKPGKANLTHLEGTHIPISLEQLTWVCVSHKVSDRSGLSKRRHKEAEANYTCT